MSKNKLKYLRSLRQKKYRQMYNKFVAEGDKLAREILATKHPVQWIVATTEWLENTSIPLPADKLLIASQREFAQLSNLKTPQGVLVVAECLPEPQPPYFSSNRWSIYLDDIQDPGNLGTMLRIARWFGASPVILSPHSVEVYNPKVIQSSMGAAWQVPVVRKSLDILVEAEDVPVYAADMSGTSVFEPREYPPGLLIIGNEGRGLSGEWHPLINKFLSIPHGPGGAGESLNAAVACGIILAAVSSPK